MSFFVSSFVTLSPLLLHLFLHSFSSSLAIEVVGIDFTGVVDQQPQQIHLSLGVNATQMVVTWVTTDDVTEPVVEYGMNSSFDQRSVGVSTLFTDGGAEKRQFHVHRVILQELEPSRRYQYRCGGDDGWSSVFAFVAIRDDTDWSPRLAIYGDMGNANAQSVPRLQAEVQGGRYDAIFHVGDFAYDMDSDNARVGDAFMRQIEPMAAYLPYQVCAGNHEHNYNFSNFDNRFSMVDTKSGLINNHFYSFDMGSAHVIAISTEFYYYTKYGWNQIPNQFRWLEEDLRLANETERRSQRPWIIVMAHKPMYCSTTSDNHCSAIEGSDDVFERREVRKGIKMKGKGELMYGLEDLFHSYAVDIELYGHEHNYQRLYPVYDNQVVNSSTPGDPYHNPKAPVIIVTGSAGCKEDHAPFRTPVPDWSAFRNSDYGFTRMTVHNKTHISVEQVSDDKNGEIVDSFVIIKDREEL